MKQYATIPLTQPNREQLIRVLEHIRETEPETFERNVRECGERLKAIRYEIDTVKWSNQNYAFDLYLNNMRCFSTRGLLAGPFAVFKIKRIRHWARQR